jgi:OmpA-OmpF porin, OOP family
LRATDLWRTGRNLKNRRALAIVLVSTVLFISAAAAAQAQTPDKPGCKDHPLLPTRMPGFRIADCKVQDFGVYEFKKTQGRVNPVEGKFTYLNYEFTGQPDAMPSALAVLRNYENAIKKLGGTLQQTVPGYWTNGNIIQDNNEVWIEAERGNRNIWLHIVEKAAMEQFIQADAAAFGNDIKRTGHAAVYGIYFDTGKSLIKPESAQAVGEIAKLLKADPALKIHVVGHTDNVGAIDANLALSKARAEAVLQALTRDHGIAAARLYAYGCGQFAPVAPNDSEEGRAKNRRVELVRQ